MTKYDEICADIEKIPEDIKLDDLQSKIKSIGKECVSIPEFCQDSVLTKLGEKFGKRVKKETIKSQFKLALSPPAPKALKVANPEPPKKKINSEIKNCGPYYSVTDDEDNEKRLSTFTLKLKKLVVQSSGPDLLCCDVITWKDVEYENWVVPQKAWVSKKGFKEHFPHTSMQWMGSEDDVQEIFASCAVDRDAVPRVRGTRVLGLQGDGNEKRWVSTNGTMDAFGWMKDPDLIYVSDGGSSIHDKIDRDKRDPEDVESQDLLSEVLRASFDLYAHETSVPIFAWFAASLHKAELMRKYGGFPLLDVYGKHGSGKTSLTSLIPWRVFHGITNYETLTATDTAFAFHRNIASTYSHALLYDEYKPSEMGTKIGNFNNIVRNIYTGSVSSRGRGDQTVVSYPSTAPFCVIGETKLGASDPAIGERCIYAHANKEWLIDPNNKDVRDRFAKLVAKPLHHCAPFLWKRALQTNVVDFFEPAEAFVSKVFEKIRLEPRIQKNMVILVIGVLCLNSIANHFNINLPPIDLKTTLEQQRLLALGVEDDDDWKEGNQRDALDVFLNDGAIMADGGDIEPDVHYALVGNELRLNVQTIEAARNQWYHKQGMESPSPGAKALISIAKSRGDGIRVCRVEFEGGGKPTCIGFNQIKYPAAGRYRVKKIRSFGGSRSEPKDTSEQAFVLDSVDNTIIHGPFDTAQDAKIFIKGRYNSDPRYSAIPASAAVGRKSKGELAGISKNMFVEN